MARATITDVKIRFIGDEIYNPSSFCIFFKNSNKNYVPFKMHKNLSTDRYYLIATCEGGLDEKFKTKSLEFDISCITIYGTEDDIRFQVVAETSQPQLTPGSYGKIEVKTTFSKFFCVLIGMRECFLDPRTEIRINGLPLVLEEGNTTESAMEKLSKIFNHDKLKEISCISFTTIPVVAGVRDYIKEINLDVPHHLCIGAFGMFKLCASYPENYYIFKEEPSARIHLTSGTLYFRNEETKEFTPFGGIVDMTPIPFATDFDKWPTENPAAIKKKMEENTMIHKRKSLGIKNIIFNAPATIIFWNDNTKTVVKCGKDDVFDPEKGIAMAVMKRALGTNETDSNYLDKVKKYLDQYHEGKTSSASRVNFCVGTPEDFTKRLKSEAREIRVRMVVSGATPWELETFDRFCRKYLDEKDTKKEGSK